MVINNPLVWKSLAACVQFGIIAWLVVRLYRKGRVFSCPECDEKVSKQHINENGVQCPICGWRLVAGNTLEEPSNDSMTRAADRLNDCPCCKSQLNAADCVALFDGRVYCRACVNQVSPELTAFAMSHSALEDVKPRSFINSLWSATCLTTLFAGMITLGFFAIILIGTVVGHAPAPGFRLFHVGALMFGFSWAFSAIIAFPMMIIWLWRILPRTVRIQDGRLIIRPPGDRYWSLDEIRWAETFSTYDMAEGLRWPRRQGIVIFPHAEKKRQAFGYMVGAEPELASVWKAFLLLANVPLQQTSPWKAPAEVAD